MDYLPVSSTKAANLTGLPLKIAKQRLPHTHSIPGRHGTSGRKFSSRKLLFDRQAVLEATPTDRRAVEALASFRNFRRECHMSIITAPYLSSSTNQLDWGFYCYSCIDASQEEPIQFREHYTAKGIIDHIDQHHEGATMQVVPDRDRTRPWIILE